MALADLFADGKADKTRIANLLSAIQRATKPVKPQDLGLIGKEHLAARFAAAGVDLRTFNYKRMLRDDAGLPTVIEIAFGYCPNARPIRRLIAGVNWSVGINNPFRQLGENGESLDTFPRNAAGRPQRASNPARPPRIAADRLHRPREKRTGPRWRNHQCRLPARGGIRGMKAVGKSIADDIVIGLRAVTKLWAKQRKQEERHASARANRLQRFLRSRRETQKDVAWECMEAAYLAASSNDTLPATARQVMYAARPVIQERTGKQLDDQYFTQTLLPDYMEEHDVDWDVVFDDRGHLREPHTGNGIGLGTLSVRHYQSEIGQFDFKEPSFTSGGVVTRGPSGCFGAVLFIEKEGFMPLFEAVNLAERFDIALMSTKGLSNTAARQLIDEMCGGHEIPLLVLHDFDKAGFSILGTLQRDTRRYSFMNDIEVIDLGLRLEDIEGLQREDAFDKGTGVQGLESSARTVPPRPRSIFCSTIALN